MKKIEEIEKAAHVYANEVCPNPSKYDAPFYTTKDKFIDLQDSFIAGAEYILKAVEEEIETNKCNCE